MRLPRPLVCFKLDSSEGQGAGRRRTDGRTDGGATGQTHTHLSPLGDAQPQKSARASGRHRGKYEKGCWRMELPRGRLLSVVSSSETKSLCDPFTLFLSRSIKNWNDLNVQVKMKTYNSCLEQIVSTLSFGIRFRLWRAALFSFTILVFPILHWPRFAVLTKTKLPDCLQAGTAETSWTSASAALQTNGL